ncbi:MAG: GMP synthase (glutamine-hydrolyzing) [Myxococcota bacterium]|jgi:GMP synthase (glutamine-hydrolysing)
MSRILIIQTGSVESEISARYGNYSAWFLDALPDGHQRCTIIRPFDGEALPAADALADYAGVLLTGSRLSVRAEQPWMAPLGHWAVQAAAHKPVLGVCFGHQLIGEALGGRVEKNPEGLEAGTISVTLTDAGRADPLFEGMPWDIAVQSSHTDVLVVPPPGAVRLAGNRNTTWQAYAWGPRLRAVQFHPELRPEICRDIFASRGWEVPVTASEHGRQILERWDRNWVRG